HPARLVSKFGLVQRLAVTPTVNVRMCMFHLVAVVRVADAVAGLVLVSGWNAALMYSPPAPESVGAMTWGQPEPQATFVPLAFPVISAVMAMSGAVVGVAVALAAVLLALSAVPLWSNASRPEQPTRPTTRVPLVMLYVAVTVETPLVRTAVGPPPGPPVLPS